MNPSRTAGDVALTVVFVVLAAALFTARAPGTAGAVLAWWAAVASLGCAVLSWFRPILEPAARDLAAALVALARVRDRRPRTRAEALNAPRRIRPSSRLIVPGSGPVPSPDPGTPDTAREDAA